ncbi:DUF4843 domain-containing protein [Aestuariibaculum sp. YM273]|uniref:DUF4843 domain-containing protein n=1 Tax=Aestuariibaculum sp. YM273 TaxID=3070659 RepID=UPI0027DBA8B2|nr:DUF4843 domain-containing protein [Aestuariibaculum sp. YM273]WMI64128.1 DUF4843 domain-containing protein [Aestuariibaculum sp. YM273]
MKNIFIYACLFCIGFIAVSCNTDEINTYQEDKDNIYFTWSEQKPDNRYPYSYIDSLGVTFAFKPQDVTSFVFKLPISVQGELSDKDRVVNLSVKAESTAKEGLHFDLPETIVLGANKSVDSIPITLYRTPEMKNESLTLILELLSNDNFSVNMTNKLIDEQTGETLNYTVFQLSVNDILETPARWFEPYLGEFTAKKMLLMTELLNIPLDYYTNSVPISESQYYGTFMQRYLNEKAAAGETIYEEDGTPMVMGRFVQ